VFDGSEVVASVVVKGGSTPFDPQPARTGADACAEKAVGKIRRRLMASSAKRLLASC
jgi:hypothetical protein